jgi:EpsI family protein
MLFTVVVTAVMTPRVRLAEQGARVDLAALVPTEFANWKVDSRGVAYVVNPQQEEFLSTIYSQTVTRTYVSDDGDRIMLSIAYGDDQTGRLRVHRPEVCYSAQGFKVDAVTEGVMQTGSGAIRVVRALAAQGGRIEPITYWMRVGESIATSGLEQRLHQLRYGLSGEIPDGLIFRVSSIGRDTVREYGLQDHFVAALLQSLSSADRQWLVGVVPESKASGAK